MDIGRPVREFEVESPDEEIPFEEEPNEEETWIREDEEEEVPA